MLRNALIAKELGAMFRGKIFIWSITLFCLIILLAGFLTCFFQVDTMYRRGIFDGGVFRIAYLWFVALISALGLLLLPVFSAMSVTQERENRTLELLQVSLLTARQIVYGKIVAGWMYYVLALFAVLPFSTHIGYLGGLGWFDLLAVLAVQAMCGLVVSAMGVCLSAWRERTAIAIVSTYVLVLAMLSVFLIATIAVVKGHIEFDMAGWVRVAIYINPIAAIRDILILPLRVDLGLFAARGCVVYIIDSILLFFFFSELAVFKLERIRRQDERLPQACLFLWATLFIALLFTGNSALYRPREMVEYWIAIWSVLAIFAVPLFSFTNPVHRIYDEKMYLSLCLVLALFCGASCAVAFNTAVFVQMVVYAVLYPWFWSGIVKSLRCFFSRRAVAIVFAALLIFVSVGPFMPGMPHYAGNRLNHFNPHVWTPYYILYAPQPYFLYEPADELIRMPESGAPYGLIATFAVMTALSQSVWVFCRRVLRRAFVD